MIPLARAQTIAAHVVEQLRPFCGRIEIAGSIRRQRPEVNDIDLVMQPRDRVGLERRITSRCKLEKGGEQNMVARMPDGTMLDLWFSYTPPVQEDRWLFIPSSAPDPTYAYTPRSRKPDNFGSLLLARTGSVAHNVALCERAKRLGRNWNPHWGVYQDGQCIASATEADIYNALGLEWIEPTAREFATDGERRRLVHRPPLQPA